MGKPTRPAVFYIFLIRGLDGQAVGGECGFVHEISGKVSNTMEGVVLVTDSFTLPGSVVTWALQAFQDKAGEGGHSLSVITGAALIGGNLALTSSSLDVVVFISENFGIDANEWVVEFGRVLKPGGVLFLQTPSVGGNNEHARADLERGLVLAGFLGVEVANSVERWGSSDGLQPLAVCLNEQLLSRLFGFGRGIICLWNVQMKARKPTWETGSSFALKKRSVAKTELDGINTNIQLDDDLEDLIDEDSLLSEEDLKKPELPAVGDCEVGATRKACKNCTCGRAQMEEREGEGRLGPTSDQLNNPQSACGSCGLGDAFRCSGCPYKGLPPFKLGEKITLTSTLLTADV